MHTPQAQARGSVAKVLRVRYVHASRVLSTTCRLGPLAALPHIVYYHSRAECAQSNSPGVRACVRACLPQARVSNSALRHVHAYTYYACIHAPPCSHPCSLFPTPSACFLTHHHSNLVLLSSAPSPPPHAQALCRTAAAAACVSTYDAVVT